MYFLVIRIILLAISNHTLLCAISQIDASEIFVSTIMMFADKRHCIIKSIMLWLSDEHVIIIRFD